MNLEHLKAALDAAEARGKELREKRDAMDAETATDEEVVAIEQEVDDAVAEVERTRANLNKRIAQDEILDADPVEMPVKKEPTTARNSQQVELTYRPDNYGDKPMFFRDMTLAKGGDPRAYERLERNNREWDTVEKRAGLNQTATTAGEFIYPVWLSDYAEKLRAGRATLDALAPQPWIATNSVNLPAITTGASASIQADGSSVSNTDWVTATITGAAQTASGRSVASYQLVDLGEAYLDQAIFSDLLGALNGAKDVAIINGSATNAKGLLNVTGINAVVYTDASPTFGEFLTPFFKAKSLMESTAFVASPDFIVLHPKVWNSFLADLDGNSLPLALMTDAAQFNRVGNFDYAGQGLVGNLSGLPVIGDANVPTTLGGGTETAALLVNRRGFSVYEDAPKFKIADQTSITTLQYQFVMWGYYACLSRQPKMISKITDTGMIPRAGF